MDAFAQLPETAVVWDFSILRSPDGLLAHLCVEAEGLSPSSISGVGSTEPLPLIMPVVKANYVATIYADSGLTVPFYLEFFSAILQANGLITASKRLCVPSTSSKACLRACEVHLSLEADADKDALEKKLLELSAVHSTV